MSPSRRARSWAASSRERVASDSSLAMSARSRRRHRRQRDPRALAELARGKARPKIGRLAEALDGRS